MLVQEADRLRDDGDQAAAASAYAAVLAVAPRRTEVRVQMGNMLKDSQQLAAAEEAYRQALADAGDDPDIYLQLGHVLKLRGQRAAALAAYGRAAELDPASPLVARELASLGDAARQRRLFEDQVAAGSVEGLLTAAGELQALRRRIDQLLALLPDLQAAAAFPVALYPVFRTVFRVPPPPADAGRCGTQPFTVLVQADREPLDVLWAQVEALRSLEHPNWKALFIGSDDARRRTVAAASGNDGRIAWSDVQPGERLGAAELRLGRGTASDWLLLLAEGAVLDQHALSWIAHAGCCTAAAAFVCDEEAGTPADGIVRFSDPVLRQAVDYDTLLEANVYGGTVAVRAPVFRQAVDEALGTATPSLRSALLLELGARTAVGHIPFPLVWRLGIASGDDGMEAHRAAVAAHLSRTRSAAVPVPGDGAEAGMDPSVAVRSHVAWRAARPDARILLIVPTRDNAADAVAFVSSLYRLAARPDCLHVTVVDNGSSDAERAVLQAAAERPGVRVLRDDGPFNWSRINNDAVRASDRAGASLLVFANDDMRMLSAGWDERLRGLLERPQVGVVGARLLYPDDTVQHAGILFGWRGSVIHDGLHEPASEPGPTRRWHITRAVGAVTGAFLATRAEVFRAAGGFDEAGLPVTYNDVDFCLKVRASGMRVLWTPGITLYHHESKSRGLDHLDPAKAARGRAEMSVLRRRWGRYLDDDPGVNPTWYPATLPFRMLAAPSAERMHLHLVRCGSGCPWRPDPGTQQQESSARTGQLGRHEEQREIFP